MASLCFESMNWSPYLGDQRADLPAQIDAAADAGFPLMGLDAPSLEQFAQGGGAWEALAQQLEARGMRCFEIQPLIVSDDEADTLRQAEAIAEMARVLRPDFIQAGLTGEPSEAATELFRRAAALLPREGSRLAVEFLPFLPLDSIRKTGDFLRRAAVPGAGIAVDTWHFFRGPDTWADLEALDLAEIAYVQFNDAPPLASDDLMYETTQRRVLPGEGHFELERFCEILRAKGYDDPVSVEILSEELRKLPLPEFAARLRRACEPFWG